MSCISRVPQCGDKNSTAVTPEPISKFASILGTIFGLVGGISSVLGATGKLLAVVSWLGGAASAGAVSGTLGGLTVVIVVGMYMNDRCTQGDGLRECIAGVVNKITESFGDAWQQLFPFTAMHDRAEIVIKSRFWDVVESSGAFVHCTDEATPRRSPIMRCYFYSSEVCAAALGALLGAGAGAIAGIFVAVAIAAAIGCATIVLCIFAILLAFLVAAAIALGGAFIGGQIGKAASEDSHPSDSAGNALALGDLVTINGQRTRREYDDGAWVIWWVNTVTLHGHVTADIPSNPFSYCDIDEQLPSDSCALPPIP